MSRNAILNILAVAVFVVLMVIFYFVRPPPGWKGKLVMYLIILAGAFVIVTIGHFVR